MDAGILGTHILDLRALALPWLGESVHAGIIAVRGRAGPRNGAVEVCLAVVDFIGDDCVGICGALDDKKRLGAYVPYEYFPMRPILSTS